MSMIKTYWVLALTTALLTGCLSGGGGSGKGSAATPGAGGGGDAVTDQPGVGQPAATSFTALVKDIFGRTSATGQPVAINGLTITFDDQQNEGAFDDLLGR